MTNIGVFFTSQSAHNIGRTKCKYLKEGRKVEEKRRIEERRKVLEELKELS